MGGPHVTNWISGGDAKRLTTTCGENEGVDVCLQRHEDDLAFFQAIYPPD